VIRDESDTIIDYRGTLNNDISPFQQFFILVSWSPNWRISFN